MLKGVAGVDWNASDNDGYSPLTLAVDWGLAESLQIILTVPEPHLDLNDIRGRNIAQIAVVDNLGDRQRCLKLLSGDRRVDWNIKNRNGDTPVMYCLKNNKIEMARCLINTPGVDLDTVDRDGRYLEDIARSVFNSLEQSNNVLISQGEEHDGDLGSTVELQECPAENDPP